MALEIVDRVGSIQEALFSRLPLLLSLHIPSLEQRAILDARFHPSEISIVLPPYITAMLLLPELGAENSCGRFVHTRAGNT